MKNSNDTIGNRTRDLPGCGAVPQPTAPPRAPLLQFQMLPMGLRRCVRVTLPPSRAAFLEILGASTAWIPKGLSRAIMENLYLYLYPD